MIHVFNSNDRPEPFVDTTSRSRNWSRGLSPFMLGPVDLYDGYVALNVENAWQFCKVYPEHTDNALRNPEPTQDYWVWATEGWADKVAHRYPMGKGAIPLYSLWDGEKLNYIQARKRIYCPLYAKAVEKTKAFEALQAIYKEEHQLWLWDFDAYDHIKFKMNYKDVLNDPSRKMGHAFVLAMMLDNQRVWEE